MKKILGNLLSMIALTMSSGSRNTAPTLGQAPVTTPFRGNVRGDKFYMHIPLKRINGKWRVKR